MKNISSIYQQTIDETMKLIHLDTLKIVTQILDKAKRINIYTSAHNCQVADNFKYKMSHFKKDIRVLSVNYEQEIEAMNTGDDVASIILSYSGKNKDLLKIAKLLKRASKRLILISSMLDTTFEQYCDFHLLLCSKENAKKEEIAMASYSSYISAQYMMDILFSMLFKRHYNEYMEKIIQERNYYKEGLGKRD